MSPVPSDPAWSYEVFQGQAPAVVQSLLALSKAVDDNGLDKGLTELVKLRVSQINSCAFCTQLHLNIARRAGVTATKLDLVAAWRDAGVFSGQEIAALDWAEHLTRMINHPVPKKAYGQLREHYSESEAIHLTAAIANINAWNRIAGGLRFAPPVAPGP
jgi:AhpD family alkylhydroperoxidase